MNPLLTLSKQPNNVLVALFNAIEHKVLISGELSPLCINICKLLNRRGYDIDNLDFKDGKSPKN